MNGLLDPEVANLYFPRHVRRSQTSAVITSSGGLLIGANPKRIGLVISCPNADFGATTVPNISSLNVDTSTTGTKQSYTIPGGLQGYLTFASMFETAATGVVAALRINKGAGAVNIFSATTAGTFSGNVPVTAGDVLQWVVTTAQVASTADFFMGLNQGALNNRVTLSIGTGFINDIGIVLPINQRPFILGRHVIGDALTEDIYAKSAGANVTLGVWDLSY